MYAGAKFKGLDVGLSAIELASRKIQGIRVVAFGHGLSKQNPLPEGSEFFRSPAQEKIRTIYSLCDAWIVPSRSEGFGLPVLEAMACRCPVIATRTGCAEDVISDGINGYIVDVEDVKSLADRIVTLLSLSEDSWKTMSDAALATAKSYTWDDATDLFEKALQAQ